MSRPETRNAVDGRMAAELVETFTQFEDDDAALVAVLWGEGGHFSSGADLKAIGTPAGNRVDPPGQPAPLGCTRMQLSTPGIAAVAGYAVAGGLELALWCDLRVVESDATFGVFCRRWGVPLIDGGTFRLPWLIGQSRAMDLILTGRPVTAAEAYDMGLANRLVAPGESRTAAEELAAGLARFPQTCLREDRMAVLQQNGLDYGAAIASEYRHGLRSLEDAAEGAARYAAGAGRHGDFR
jgi:enoyl-CoA hydratase